MSLTLSQLFSSKLFRGRYADEDLLADFKIEGNDQEKKRLTSLTNRIMRGSEMGKSIMEKAANEGYSVSFDNLMNANGCCNGEDKKITLNPSCSDNQLVACFTHEARHAGQMSEGMPTQMGQMEFKSEIISGRAMEADAQACSAAVCFEMAKSGDSMPWEKFEGMKPKITAPMIKCIETGLTSAALTDSFLAWYEEGNKSGYENCYVVKAMNMALEYDAAEMLPYSEKMTTAEIIEKACRSPQGGSYFTKEAALMETAPYADISRTVRKTAENFFKQAGRANDGGLVALPIRGETGTEKQNTSGQNKMVLDARYLLKTRGGR